MKFRRWNLSTHESYTFDILNEPDALRKGWSLPNEGTRVMDKDHKEIFHNDLVAINGNTYWVRYLQGAYLLELTHSDAKEKENRWLHEAILSKEEIQIVGNSHQNADHLVHHINTSRSKDREYSAL